MNTTMLVHESFCGWSTRALRLEDRRQFLPYAAKTMRNVIIDAAREHRQNGAGGGAEHMTLAGDDALAVRTRSER